MENFKKWWSDLTKPAHEQASEQSPTTPTGTDRKLSPTDELIAKAVTVEKLKADGHDAEAKALHTALMDSARGILGNNPLLLLFDARQLQADGHNHKAEMAYRLMVDLTREFDDPNLLKGTAAGFLGKFYFQLNRYADAEPLYQQALQTYRNLPLHEHYAPYAETLQQIGVLYEATGRKTQARECYRQVAATRQESPASGVQAAGGKPQSPAREPDWLHLESLSRLASLSQEERDYGEAESSLRETHDILRSTVGEDSPQFDGAVTRLVGLYKMTRRYADAEPLLIRRLAIRRAALGDTHPDVMDGLNELSVLYHGMGREAEGDALLMQVLQVGQVPPEQRPQIFANNIITHADEYSAMGNLDVAESLYTRGMELTRAASGEHHPVYPSALLRLSSLYFDTGRYERSLTFCQQALQTEHAAGRETGAFLGAVLNNLGMTYKALGRLAEAEPVLRQALEVRRSALGVAHADVGAALMNLASLHAEMHDYVQAESLYREALTIMSAALGEHHPDVGSVLHNMAQLFHETGDYAQALMVGEQALDTLGRTLSEHHPKFAATTANLAWLCAEMGDYSRAESLLQQVLKITGLHPSEHASALDCLAYVCQQSGKPDEAATILQTALTARLTTFEGDHPHIAYSLNNLATVYAALGRYTEAEPLLVEALGIRQRLMGDRHGTVALTLNNLARLYMDQGRYAQAEPLYAQASTIWSAVLGENHPRFGILMMNQAGLCAATDRDDEALALMQRAEAVNDHTIGQVFAAVSESQRMALLSGIQASFLLFMSLVSGRLPDSPAAVRTALDLALRRKAVGAEALAAQRDAILGGKYPALEPKLQALTTLRCQIVQKTLAGPGTGDISAHQELLSEWNNQKERLEAEIVRLIPEMNLEQKLRGVDRQAVALALPVNTVLVEFVRFDVFDFKAVRAHGELPVQPPHYLAFVLAAQAPDNVQMIDLGPAEPIDQMIATFRASITGEGESRGYEDQEVPVSEVSDNITAGDGTALRAAIFDPLMAAIGDRKRLLLAPDGDLTRLPFEVLPTSNGRRLIDDYRISYLGTGRDVLRFGAAAMGQATAPLVVADPDFDLGAKINENLQQPASESGVTLSSLPRHSRDMDGGAMHFGRLPGTQVEGQRIAQMLGVEPRLAANALEAQLKACRSPLILHLATHGFFLPDQEHDPNKEQAEMMSIGNQSTERMGRFSGRGLENPLLRSGLALAGVNTWQQHGIVPAEAEDGILTAEDVSGLDLLATELVVLSACETGLGEVHTGEGVFGLRRAFVLAGAKTLVMSLWKVSDLATAILMERFYVNLLQRKLGRDESLRDAQFYTRDVTVGEIRDAWLSTEVIENLASGNEKEKSSFQRLARKSDEHRPFSDVQYWGAFICQGDPAPLV